MAVENNPVYQKVLSEITAPLDPSDQVWITPKLNHYLEPKAAEIFAANHHPLHTRFQIYDKALDSLGTLVTKAEMLGQKDKALKLAQVHTTASTDYLNEVLTTFGIRVTRSTIEAGDTLEIVLRAARHIVIAAKDLDRTSMGLASVNKQTELALGNAFILLTGRPEEVTRLFGPDGKNELSKAALSPFQIKSRGRLPYP